MPLFIHLDDQTPSETRWSFEEFESTYELTFSIKPLKTFSNGGCEEDGYKTTKLQELNTAPAVPGLENGHTGAACVTTRSGAANYEKFLPQGKGLELDSSGLSIIQHHEKWPLRAWPSFPSSEMQELAETLTRDIVHKNTNVSWDSIKGLENAKQLLKEAVVMPIKYPQYFTGLLSPWKGILLFGSSGTGKTMLAKAVASECNTTFFNISASSIVSKWRGDSEKLVRVLFELARHCAPSTIFLDEIDAIISQRGEGRSEHEASRRLKTELLVQMDGLMQSSDLVFVLGATNLPWELDGAMLRRFEKRILVPLPEPEARKAMCEELLPTTSGKMLPYDLMVESTEGYSGSDIRMLCKEAAMQPLRRLMAVLEKNDGSWTCEEGYPQLGPITDGDIKVALKTTRPAVQSMTAKYQKFDDEFGNQCI